MLKLINIIKNDSCISADYIPEDSYERGSISVDLSGNVLYEKATTLDGDLKMYFSHARKALFMLLHEDSIPNEKIVIWY
ncbi:MAG: hypothetical protein VB118_00080 [Oscillospiraceae bacterium]|nr:hypothetical protein [Oscillospiraceae bacterium]